MALWRESGDVVMLKCNERALWRESGDVMILKCNERALWRERSGVVMLWRDGRVFVAQVPEETLWREGRCQTKWQLGLEKPRCCSAKNVLHLGFMLIKISLQIQSRV